MFLNTNEFKDVSGVADWIAQLESSDSRLHKEEVLRKALAASKLGSAHAKCFLAACYYAYNPFATYGVKQVPTSEGITDAENPWPDFWGLVSLLRGRELTGNAAREAITSLMNRFDSTEWNGIVRRVLIKDLRCGVSDKTINKIVKGTEFEVPIFSCQLAQDSDDHPSKMTGRKRLEVKLDGVRVLAHINNFGDVTMYSRNGKVFENFEHIAIELKKAVAPLSAKLTGGHGGYILDGEVMATSFQDLMKQARRKKDAKADDSVFHVFDILPAEEFYEGYWNAQQYKRLERLERARDVFETIPGVRLMPGIDVDLDTSEGQDVMRRYADEAIEQGFEGIMIKDLDAPYECKRSGFWLKWKPVHDFDLKVVGVEEGTGKNVGRLGALICEGTDQGKHIRVNVGSGFTDAQREEIWRDQSDAIGQTVVVMCDAITQNQDGGYSLRFPRFKTFREDK